MLPNSSQLAGHNDEAHFVEEVRVTSRPARSPRIETLIWVCWVLIALKSAFVVWAVDVYRIPFSPLWVIVPTVAFASVCTAIYYFRRR